MQETVLAASSSDYRRWWYCHRLAREGFVIRTANDAIECLAELRHSAPDVLILETPLLWGGADGVLDALATEPELAETRVLLVTVKNEAGEMYRISRYAVDDVLSRVEIESRLIDHLHRLLRDNGIRACPLSV